MIPPRVLTAAAGAFLAIAALAGCAAQGADLGGNSSTTPSESAADQSFNDQDVMFAQMMIPHHRQAVEMSEMILTKGDVESRITELAERVRDAQAPEIDLMTSWLEAWGEKEEASGHAGHGMEGMLSDAQLQELQDANGQDASMLFLESMIAHHMGAISMAEAEVENGRNADAMELAQQIIDDQRAEIEAMNKIIASL